MQKLISEIMQKPVCDIKNIVPLKKGMTNNSYKFQCDNDEYILRIPGEGTKQLINRENEYNVYKTLKNYNICEEIYYISKANGYKISKYFKSAHVCNPSDMEEVKQCMNILKKFHSLKLKVDHTFDLFEKIEFYESLRQSLKETSFYDDYEKVKKNVYELKQFVAQAPKEWGLSHIDSVSDNFLYTEEGIILIDWEYSAMADQHVDIAMFAIYSMYDDAKIDELIDIYFGEEINEIIKTKIYAYIAICGLLWSNWCEYKEALGIEFSDYAKKQFEYAKRFSLIAKEKIKLLEEYKVDNAIIMSAGSSKRFAPLSYEKPKALWEVKGDVLIERQIKQLKEAGIENIIIITGYMKEKFEYLIEKYNVIIIENNEYANRNNYYSLYCAKDYLSNSYICCSDNYYEENIFSKYVAKSYYSSVYIEGKTSEWCILANEDNKIIKCTIGGENTLIMRGHAYFDKKFSDIFKTKLKENITKSKNHDEYWEDIYLDNNKELDLYINIYEKDLIKEIDSLQDLRQIDDKYKTDSKCKIMESIEKKYNILQKDIQNIIPIVKNNITIGINFTANNIQYTYYYSEYEDMENNKSMKQGAAN